MSGTAVAVVLYVIGCAYEYFDPLELSTRGKRFVAALVWPATHTVIVCLALLEWLKERP